MVTVEAMTRSQQVAALLEATDNDVFVRSRADFAIPLLATPSPFLVRDRFGAIDVFALVVGQTAVT